MMGRETNQPNGNPIVHRGVYARLVKPLLDRLFAAVLLVLLSPLMAALAIAVKTTSPGAVFFRQKRVGLHKAHFMLLKFRSMRSDAPGDVPTHLLANPQAHITRVGYFLRRSSLDELPQLFNILRGEMSFIGPRPALWNQFDLIAERDRWGANDVMPGLTGWAQANGRDELPIPVKAERDGYYVKRLSLWLDVKILLLTVLHVLRAKGVVEGRGGQ
jgi:O-antigen biosynthesis protein WbqP